MKNLLFYVIVGLIGITLVVGVVLFLRSRNAPTEIGTLTSGAPAVRTGTTAPAAGGQQTKPLRPFVPAEQTPKAAAWKEGDPVPPPAEELTIP